MASVESISVAPSISGGAKTCTLSTDPLHSILGMVRTLHQRGAPKWLARTTGKSIRMCKYYLSGRYAPGYAETLAIVRALRAELEAHKATLEQFSLDLR